jgi:hypothetical protein
MRVFGRQTETEKSSGRAKKRKIKSVFLPPHTKSHDEQRREKRREKTNPPPRSCS